MAVSERGRTPGDQHLLDDDVTVEFPTVIRRKANCHRSGLVNYDLRAGTRGRGQDSRRSVVCGGGFRSFSPGTAVQLWEGSNGYVHDRPGQCEIHSHALRPRVFSAEPHTGRSRSCGCSHTASAQTRAVPVVALSILLQRICIMAEGIPFLRCVDIVNYPLISPRSAICENSIGFQGCPFNDT